jgi:tRNA A37 threonylcarbamoyladenosine synthetase subunit TsaC/SUA5/YrdC
MDFDLLNAVSYLEKPDGLIAIPLKHRYVLVCRIGHKEAMSKLYRISQTQSSWQPVLLGYDLNALATFMENIPAIASRLMEQHWPGELIIRMPGRIHVQQDNFEPSELGVMQPADPLTRDILSLQPGGVLLVVDACRYNDLPAQSAAELFNAFGDDVDFVLARDECIRPAGVETIVSIERDGSLRILRSGEVVLD